jgi:hypothetical protein
MEKVTYVDIRKAVANKKNRMAENVGAQHLVNGRLEIQALEIAAFRKD